MKFCKENYYRVYAAINLDAIHKNIENLKKRIKEGTKVVAVIKADGYGHGAVPVAKTVNDLVDAFAVATVDEAENLRNHNLLKPIYVIGYTHESQLERMIYHKIRPTVFTYEMAKAVSQKAKEMGEIAKIHIKIDTGMSRIGFKVCDESVEEIIKISKLDNLTIEGIFTHFATADEVDKSKAYEQFDKFMAINESLKNNGLDIPIMHCSNSAAMIEMPKANLSAVRAGIAMYGLYPSDEVDKSLVELTPALELKSHVVYIKTIEKGTPVSYGGTFVADRDMLVATIPVGYGDGYRRSLSNKGYVLIKGKKAPILGRVCMDQFMVDVTDIEGVKKDDTAVLIGRSGDEFISTEMLAEMAGETFNYEIVCDLGKRIPRIYYRDGKIVGAKDYYDDKYDF